MKEFWVYTLMRAAVFVASFAVVFGLWFAVTEDVPVLWAMVLAFVVSGVASYFLLQRQREQFAVKVEGRAQRAARRFEESRSREDTD
ncbi:DUF4229 domain-containing protein [Nocardioides sp. TF02-7]|uniref:DUF4229 domain-containing protein n=1 Tax=Nocardioides sp. TF02-7 TaxID=2917724 RepID=UPI001F06CEDE|nr:DUF4229 domain-containing protein [Nocardioides sp. TF02-7]UMG93841.1 DUF4229 domain-containing protein [Nocardioides sp. TF02-7]